MLEQILCIGSTVIFTTLLIYGIEHILLIRKEQEIKEQINKSRIALHNLLMENAKRQTPEQSKKALEVLNETK